MNNQCSVGRGRWRWLASVGTIAALVMGSDLRAAGPDLSISTREYPDANAVVVRWEQDWTLAADGAIHRRDHQWVKLFNRRQIGRYADRTIDYREGEDEVIVHVAQTHLPDGTIMPVPDYGYNLGATEAVAGWPDYADWRQRIISFSGVQPGATLELDYEVVTRAGVLPCLSAELRLDGPDPIHERIIRVSTGANEAFKAAVDGADAKEWTEPGRPAAAGHSTHAWRFTALPAASAESMAPDWRRSGPRLRFSTDVDAAHWAAGWITPVSSAAQADKSIEQFAQDAVKDPLDERGRVEAVAKALAKRFNFLESREAWRSRSCRPASVAFSTNYGNPLEAAAIGMAALGALNISARPVVAVDADAWSSEVPTDDAFAGIVLRVETSAGQIWLHPREGILASPGNWGRRILLDPADTKLETTRLALRGEERASDIALTAKIDLAEDGSAQGKLTLQLSGVFADRSTLGTTDSQKALVEAIVQRLLVDFTVTACSTTQLSDESFAATADVSAAALPALASSRVVQLGDGPIFLKDIHLPLATGERTAPVQLNGTVLERVDVRIGYPSAWRARVLPQTLDRVAGDWGLIEQTIANEDHGVRITRTAQLAQPVMEAAGYAALRDALNILRADGYRTLVAGL